eukprot:Skav229551  [mRNA]  locus=scaffold568:343765:344874:+ [translate_table: standard]
MTSRAAGSDTLELLKPSVKGSAPTKFGGQAGKSKLRPVVELHFESALTCLCFGEVPHPYNLLACGSRDGSLVLYRLFGTDPKLAAAQPCDGSVEVHRRMVGHSGAITSLLFTMGDRHILTTSLDSTIRLWTVDCGDLLRIFEDEAPLLAAAFLPLNPGVVAVAGANSMLRLCEVETGQLDVKVEFSSQIRALTFDDTGRFLLAGTRPGHIHVLQVQVEGLGPTMVRLLFEFMVSVADGNGVSCVTFVSAAHGRPACLLVNCCDSSMSIWDCIYDDGFLKNLDLRHWIEVPHRFLPVLKNCFSPSAGGYAISASEDGCLYVCALRDHKMYYLQRDSGSEVAVRSVAVNPQDTVLASADVKGDLVLWRRVG